MTRCFDDYLLYGHVPPDIGWEDSKVLDVPGALQASSSNGTVSLSWSAAPVATGYDVQRSPDGVTWTTLAANRAGLTYSDTPGAGTWYYRVRAVNQKQDVTEWSPYVTPAAFLQWNGADLIWNTTVSPWG